MDEILGNLIGGIGVFFVGLHMITKGLKEMTGRRLRILFANFTGTEFRAGLIGLLSGFVFQSMSAIAFIVASLITSGKMNVRNAFPIIFWANVGAGIIILIAVLNIQTLILFVLGAAGISLAFEKPARYHHLASILFGIGLLFYGLFMIRAGTAPLAEKEWFRLILLHGQHSFLLAFLVGAVLTALSQSSTAVTILAITFTQSGLLSAEQTIMIIYGANLGSIGVPNGLCIFTFQLWWSDCSFLFNQTDDRISGSFLAADTGRVLVPTSISSRSGLRGCGDVPDLAFLGTDSIVESFASVHKGTAFCKLRRAETSL